MLLTCTDFAQHTLTLELRVLIIKLKSLNIILTRLRMDLTCYHTDNFCGQAQRGYFFHQTTVFEEYQTTKY